MRLRHRLIIRTSLMKHKTLENQGESLRLKIQHKELEALQKSKYLGGQIDNSLDRKKHIKKISSTVSRGMGFLKHAKSFRPGETLKTMYTGIVEPHIFATAALYTEAPKRGKEGWLPPCRKRWPS